MGTISSGVGLISGINYQELVSQLMQIESRPLRMLQERVETLQGERTAFISLSALILAVRNAASRFDETSLFRRAKAVSSDTNVLQATASQGALPGSYSFTVHSLVATQQMITAGFRTADATPVGAGRITIESAAARLTPRTSLDALHGGAGVRRGVLRITDRSGTSADIDLSAALTLDDVINAINGQATVNVTASVSGGHLVLTDHTGQTVSALRVAEVGNGRIAADLGILGSASGDVLTGSDIVYVTNDTPLDLLNDGNGIRRDGALPDFQIQLRDGSTIDVDLSGRLQNGTRLGVLNDGGGVRLGTIRITNRKGTTADVDLRGADNLGDVLTAIKNAGLQLDAMLVKDRIVITDSSGGTGKLKVEDLAGGYAAKDLGIAQDVDGATLTGTSIYRVTSLGDVIRAINFDGENTGHLVASLRADGKGIRLVDTSAGTGTTTVIARNGSRAAEDLGILTSTTTGVIESSPLMAGLQTVLLRSLKGGSGIDRGTIRITARDGTMSSEIDLSGLYTLSEVIEAINDPTHWSGGEAKVTASINPAANGIVLTDVSGGTGRLVVTDVVGRAAADLNIAVDASVARVDSGNLQLQYLSENTRLSDLNAGRGVARGKFKIIAANGASATVDLTQGDEVTLGDVIREIKSRGIGVDASINATGDGLLLTDTTGGAGQLKVEEVGGTTAADLNILGTAALGTTTLDGSYECAIEIDADDSLNDVMAKINAAKRGVRASVLNDGSRVSPYRLVLTSEQSGRRGELIIDPGQTGLSFSVLSEARDAVVFFGQPGSGQSLLLSSSTNTLDGAVPNVKIDLLATSRTPVEVNVSRDVDSLVSDIKVFVTTFNAVLDRMKDLTSFNSKTYEKGALFGDATLEQIRSRLYGLMRKTVADAGVYRRFSDIGLTFANGAKLEFDEDRFREAVSAHREDVETLFTKADVGLGTLIDKELNNLTVGYTGLIDRHNESLQNQEEMLKQRIDDMQILLDAKEQRLLNQFYAMEQVLALLQSQQSALSSLSSLFT